MVRNAFRADPLVLSGHGLGASSEQLEGATKCEGCRKEGLLFAKRFGVSIVKIDVTLLLVST